MTEFQYLNMMAKNCDVNIQTERENINRAEAKIELLEGYKQSFLNRLSDMEKNK